MTHCTSCAMYALLKKLFQGEYLCTRCELIKFPGSQDRWCAGSADQMAVDWHYELEEISDVEGRGVTKERDPKVRSWVTVRRG